ncbi:MOSC domain-containing protein [Paenibacillus sp. MBLB4367]|uniref:MOSC domain-containing protein n=1 Tax=Paenibacillus sp. MBLB4367 TaxID=3384767 RepID=UPI003908306D
MKQAPVGTVKDIYRYPVKSMAGERIPETKVEAYGLYGDRCYAFTDRTKQGWSRYITAREVPELLSYRARLADHSESETGMDAAVPQVVISAPDGRLLEWEEELLRTIPGLQGRHADMETFVPGSDPSSDLPGLLAVDSAGVLLITEPSLRKLESLWGNEADIRRFRPNIVISLDADVPFAEKNWIGSRLIVGNAVFQADLLCERCSMIGLDPDTLERNSTLLRTVVAELDGCFGLYASVLASGSLRVGDTLYIAEAENRV